MPGMALPPITLPATDGTTIGLAGLSGRSVLAVYPWTGRPGAHGSTPELEGFRDLATRFAERDTRLFGLSLQSTAYQRELVQRLRLPFPILSDREAAFATALALPSFATGGETYLKRLTLAVRDGVIERVFFPVMDPAGHPGEVLCWLETLG
jgi:peroxiredoxin